MAHRLLIAMAMTCAYCGEEVEGIKNDEGLVVDTKHDCDQKSLSNLMGE